MWYDISVVLFFTPIRIKRNRWNETNRSRGHEKRSWTQELEEDHIHTFPDRQQSKRNGPYDLITSFSKTRNLNTVYDACFRYSNFLQDKNINRMMNINDNLVASLQLCANQDALNMVDDTVHSNVWHHDHISCNLMKQCLYLNFL